MTFEIPVAVPSDRTEVAVDCSATNTAGAAAQLGDAATWNGVAYGSAGNANGQFWWNDPLKIYQQSVMTKWTPAQENAGNCWYFGRDAAQLSTNVHRFLCKDVGALATGTSLTLAFQFVVTNLGKDMADGYLAPLVDSMTCVMNVNVQDSTSLAATASAKVWYTSTNTIQMDGGASSKYRKYAGFFVTAQAYKYEGTTAAGDLINYPVPSLGQAMASQSDNFNAGQVTADKNSVRITLQLSASDFVAPDAAYKGSGSMAAAINTPSVAGQIANYAALRTLPFVPNKDHTSDAKTLTVQLYGHTAVGTVASSTSRVNPTLALGGAAASRAATTGTFNMGAAYTTSGSPLVADAALRFFPTDWAALLPTGSLGTGVLSFTMAKDKWGQTCENANNNVNCLWCNEGTLVSGDQYYTSSAQGDSSSVAANKAEGTGLGTGAAVGDILVFKTKSVTATSAGNGRFAMVDTTARDFIIHSQSSNAGGTTVFAGACTNIRPWNMYWDFSSGATADTFFAMPASWSAIRGRGGFGSGSTNQFLMQRFFQMKTSTDTDFFAAMINHYVYPGATEVPTANAGLSILPSMPLWVSEQDASQNAASGATFKNDGTEALNTFKIYLAAAAVPVDAFYGFPMPAGTPFMKATGDNEVEVITTRAGGVKCYMYGNENGLGFCNKVDNPANWAYERLLQFREMNFMVCEIGVTAAAAGGEIIVVPFRMTDNTVATASNTW
jgi:hypothetical protein